MAYTFGLQMYSLRDDTALDPVATLKKVADMGWRNIELCGSYGMNAADMKAILDGLGLKVVSAHVGAIADPEAFRREVEFQHAMGNTDIILPYYSMNSLEEAKRAVETIAKLGEAYRAEGFRFGYHNHAFEFQPLPDGDIRPIDLLSQVEEMKFQPDVYWIRYAGCDPVEFIRDHPGRILSVHMKEYAPDGTNIEFGNGILPWQEIMAEAEKAGTTLGILEQEEYTCLPLDSVKLCLDNIRKIFG